MKNVKLAKYFTIVIFLVLITAGHAVSAMTAPIKHWNEGSFSGEINLNKGNAERQKQIYLEYILAYFTNEMRYDESVKLIDKFIADFPDSQYIDDLKWIKAYELRYFIHDYKGLKDVYTDLLEQYQEVKIDEMIGEIQEDKYGRLRSLKKLKLGIVKTKEDLEKEFEEIKKLLKDAEQLEEVLKNENEPDKIVNKSIELAAIWRKFFDSDRAKAVYLEGVKKLGEDIRGAELVFELANMYLYDTRKVASLPLPPLKYPQTPYEKAQEYYLEVYKTYPKSKQAPKALEEAAELYMKIPSGQKEIPETREDGWARSEDGPTTEPVFDYSKSAELYEKIWKEYPGWEGIKGVLQKVKNAFYSDKQNGKISEINYLKEVFEIDKILYKDDWKKYPDLPIIAKTEELFKKAEIYKGLYGEYPTIGQLGLYPTLLNKIKEIDELIQKKQLEKGGEK